MAPSQVADSTGACCLPDSARGPDDDGQAEARQGRIGWSQVSNHRFMLHGVLALRQGSLKSRSRENLEQKKKMALT